MHEVKYVGSGGAMRAVCDCKGYMHCGLCAHSLHALHLPGKIDMLSISKRIEPTGKSGRKKKRLLHEAFGTQMDDVMRMPLYVGMSVYDKRYGVGTVLSELGFAEPAIQWVVLFLNPEEDVGPCGVCVNHCVTNRSKHLILLEDQVLDMIDQAKKRFAY